MMSLRVDSSIEFTLHSHIAAEGSDRGSIAGEPFETGLQNAAVVGRDAGAALMRQPNFHAGELSQQASELFEDPVAGRT